jgi:large subunit ribosomal protein L9
MAVKVVLRSDVEKLGEKGTVQNVSGGYARNYLIPKGLAVLATPGELRMVEENRIVQERKLAKQEQAQRATSEKIDGMRLTFTARAGSQGRLYGSVTAGDIASRLSAAIDAEFDRRKIVLEEPIRSLGEHPVTIQLVGRLRPSIVVVVESDGVVEDEEPVEGVEGEAQEAAEEGDAQETPEAVAASNEA